MYTLFSRSNRLPIVTAVALITALLIALSWHYQRASAQVGLSRLWSIDAMACVPNGATTRNNLVQTSHGHARYTDGKTGDLYLICPFTNAQLHGTTVRSIELTYRNNSNRSKVSATLRMMDKRTGDVSDALSVSTGACLLDSLQLGNPYVTCQGGSGGHVLDFNRFYYYVQLSLQRPQASDDIRVVGASIW